MGKNRESWLDMAKGVGICLVVSNHIGVIPSLGQKYLQFYMPMFFIAAGFTYKYKSSFKEFVTYKIKRLLVPYFIYSMLLLLFDIFLNLIGQNKNEILLALFGIGYGAYVLKLGGSPLFTIYNAPMWFLLAIFNAYLLFYVEFKLLKTTMKDRKYIWMLLFINFLISKILSYMPFLLPWSLDTAFMSANFMFVGQWLSEKKGLMTRVYKYIGGGGYLYTRFWLM